MLRKLNLKARLLLFICLVTLLSFSITVYIISTRSFRSAKTAAFTTTRELAYHHGGDVGAEIQTAADAALFMAEAMAGMANAETPPARSQFNALLKGVFDRNPDFWSVYTGWEKDALDGRDADFIDTPGSNGEGRYQALWMRGVSGNTLSCLKTYERNDPKGKWYWIPMNSGKVYVSEPNVYNVGGKDRMLVSIVAPIVVNGKSLGVCGVDYGMDKFASMIEKIRPFDSGYAGLLSNEGKLAAHPNPETVGKNIRKMGLPESIATSVANGVEESAVTLSAETGKESYFIFTPISVADCPTPWSLAVSVPMERMLAEATSIRNISITIGIVSVLVMVLVVHFITGALILKPIGEVASGLKEIAQGEADLTRRLEIRRNDEIGQLAHWFNTFIENIQKVIGQTMTNADQVGEASASLATISTTLSDAADSAQGRVGDVHNAAQTMDDNISEVSAAINQASSNLQVVATATEEMTSTISEVAQQAESARGVSNSAVEKSTSASEKMDQLGTAAVDIGKVTEAISEISEQTNLLALNATIEAARAGEAGKGFAVVAGEIKALSNQTAEATQEIRSRIAGIQKVASESVSEMEGVAHTISEVNGIIGSIAASVEEQSVATQEIAGNITQAASGLSHVSDNVSSAASHSTRISHEIAEVSAQTTEMNQGSSDVQENAKTLHQLSQGLQSLVARFKV